MKVLSLSDKMEKRVQSPKMAEQYGDVDFVLGCGDLPYYYLEYVVDALRKPVFFVRGNHASVVEYSNKGNRSQPGGATDLHRRVVHHKGLILAGFEGSIRYKRGPFQYSQGEMWWLVMRMVPRLLVNMLRYGRALDILVTHSPARGIQDREDRAHRGFRALRWMIRVFKPAYHFHGHIHLDNNVDRETLFEGTKVVNSFGAGVTELELDGRL
jgi:Icc-related predicted phosphoesterase